MDGPDYEYAGDDPLLDGERLSADDFERLSALSQLPWGSTPDEWRQDESA